MFSLDLSYSGELVVLDRAWERMTKGVKLLGGFVVALLSSSVVGSQYREDNQSVGFTRISLHAVYTVHC